MRILRFNENKKTKKEELDGISTFDVKSLEKTKDDLIGFVDYEEVKDKEIKKVKGDVEVTTPGLKKSIKKFEDFSITIEMGDDNSAESTFEPSKLFSINPNEEECCSDCQCDPCDCGGGECCPECDCNPCECSDGECCNGCSCNPCECEEEDGNVIPFGQFI
jgi:hypothetical protein